MYTKNAMLKTYGVVISSEVFVENEVEKSIKNRFLLLFCLLTSILFCLAAATNTATAATATYYLDAVNGDDSNPGSSNQPWQTITKVESDAEEGDTVIIRRGAAEVFRYIFDKDLTNYNSGISVLFGGEDGIDWAEEYLWHNKIEDDHKVVYIKADTSIYMVHNERNMRHATARSATTVEINNAPFLLDIGIAGEDGIPDSGDEGVIRYRVDRDLQLRKYFWSINNANAEKYPAYTGPFTFGQLEYEPSIPVVGTTGSSHPDMTQDRVNSYYRGVIDDFGDEWHTLAFADDDEWIIDVILNGTVGWGKEWLASDGKTILFVVNPKTPCISFKALAGDAQFYTTPPKAYWIPKVHKQITYLTDNVEIKLVNIMDGDIYYKFDSGAFQIYTGPINSNTLSEGEHILEYYYDNNYHKTRKIVKNPGFPSADEGHGYMLWKDDAELEAIKNRLQNDYPNNNYNTRYEGLKVNTAEYGNGHQIVDNYYNTGRRIGSDNALVNAFIALVDGYDYTKAGESDSYATYAKKMLLDNVRKIDDLGFGDPGGDPRPCQEIYYRSYYDVDVILSNAFAYDILIKDFKSTQYAGGITSIEDYKIRDMLARFALESMMQIGEHGYMTLAKRLEAGQITKNFGSLMAAVAMPSYNTPYYGTSGFDGTSATHLYTPYPSYPVTWKEVLYTETNPIYAYPNQAHRYDEGIIITLVDGVPVGTRLNFITESELYRAYDGMAVPPGSFFTDILYFGYPMHGHCLYIVANVMKIKEEHTYPYWEMAFDYANKEELYGVQASVPSRGDADSHRFPQLLLINERFPEIAPDAEDNLNGSLIPTLGATWAISNQLTITGIYGLIFYHDAWDITPPEIPENLTAIAVSEHRIDLTWSESSDSQSGIDYYNIYRDGIFIAQSSSTSYSDNGLTPESTYTYRVSAVNGHGAESEKSSPALATTLVDTNPPIVLSADGSYNSVKILFNEPLDTASAENIINYSINKGISVIAASLMPDQVTVTLTTSSHTEGICVLTLNNIQDTYANAMPESSIGYLFAGNLVLYLNCDNNVDDQSGNNNNGIWNGNPSYGPGRIEQAFSLDGTATGSYVLVNHSDTLDGMSQLTLSVWAKKNSANVGGRVLCKHVTYSLNTRGDTAQNYLVNSHGTLKNLKATSASINDTKWHHYAVTYDGAAMKLFIDGQQADSKPLSDDIAVQLTRNLLIGKGPAGNAFHGSIDDVRIYNRALDGAEVLTLYNAGSNLPPELSPIGYKSVNEGVELTFTVTATDADGDTITYSATGTAISAGADFNDQTLTFSWTPTYEQARSYQVTFTASDTHGAQDDETITITVSNVNRAPVFAAIGDKSVKENSNLSFSVSATDPDGDTITYSLEPLPTGAVFIKQTFTWTPDYNQAESYDVTFIARDIHGAQDSETITITVNNVNRPPVLSAIGNKSIYTDELLTFTVNATDIDGDTIIYSASNLPLGANFDDVTQTFTWTPSDSQVGSHDDVRFIADDSQEQTVEPITITVTADTSAPSVANCAPAADSIQAPLNTLIILHVVDDGKGVDPDSVTIEVNDNPVYSGNTTKYSSIHGKCHRIGTKANYTFIYQPKENFEFDESVSVKVNAKDLADNPNPIEYSYSFTTEMLLFGKNTRVDLRDVKKGRPVTVCDNSGNIWAAWHAGVVDSRDIYIGKLEDGAVNFDSSVQLTSDAAECNPVTATGSDGKLYVAWQDNRNGNWDIYVSTSNDWSAEIRVTDSNDNQINPAIVVDSSNNASIVCEDDRHGNQDIYIATSSNAFLTKAVSQITSDTSDQVEPAIAVDSDNTIYVVWTDTRIKGKNDIYGAASNDGPWTNIPVVTEEDGQSSPAIATEAVGSILHLVWVDDRTTDGDDDIFYAKTTGGLSPLTGSSIIDDDTGADQISPVIIATGTGNDLKVFACWRDERNANADLYLAEISPDYSAKINSGDKANVFVGDDGTNSDQSEPAIGIDGDGHPYLVWTNEKTDICYAGSTFIESKLASTNVSITSETTVGTMRNAIQSVDDVSAELPQGAYLCDVEVTISRIKNPPKFNFDRFTGAYEFGPSGMEFTKPVTITIPYEVSGSENVLYKAYWYNSLTNTLSQEGITDVQTIVTPSGLHALRFKTTHFSPFIIGGGIVGGVVGGLLGGGGGGCSMSPDSQAGIVELLLPYIGLTVAMVILKLRDRRKRETGDITKSEC